VGLAAVFFKNRGGGRKCTRLAYFVDFWLKVKCWGMKKGKKLK